MTLTGTNARVSVRQMDDPNVYELRLDGCATGGYGIADIPRVGEIAFSWNATADELARAIWNQRRKAVVVAGGPLPVCAAYCILEA